MSEKGALRRARNKEILDGVADALLEFPATKLEVHGDAGVETDDASLQLLATHYSPMRYPEDREALAGRLAQNRAEAIVKALVDRGVAKERLAVGARASGHRTEMEVEPMDGLKED